MVAVTRMKIKSSDREKRPLSRILEIYACQVEEKREK
jgi:hypothetical protein